MAIGGPIESITINGRYFSVAGDADVSIKLGGFETDVQPNGDGTAREIKTRVMPQATGVQLSVDDTRGDFEFLQDFNDSTGGGDIGVNFVSGSTAVFKGVISGEMQMSMMNATASMDLKGLSKRMKIVKA